MKTTEKLSLQSVWQSDGHLSELALTVAADGEDALLPSDAADHLGECALCMQRLGEAAGVSMIVGEAMGLAEVAARPAFPIRAVGVALAFAAIGAIPAMSAAPGRVAAFLSTVLHIAPQVVHGMFAIAKAGGDAIGPALQVASVVSVCVLLLAGMAIARAMPRQVANHGGA